MFFLELFNFKINYLFFILLPLYFIIFQENHQKEGRIKYKERICYYLNISHLLPTILGLFVIYSSFNIVSSWINILYEIIILVYILFCFLMIVFNDSLFINKNYIYVKEKSQYIKIKYEKIKTIKYLKRDFIQSCFGIVNKKKQIIISDGEKKILFGYFINYREYKKIINILKNFEKNIEKKIS